MDFKLSLAQARLLKLIDQYTLKPYHLAKVSNVSHQTTLIHLSKMELKGLIIRDRYNHEVYLTKFGKKVLSLIK